MEDLEQLETEVLRFMAGRNGLSPEGERESLIRRIRDKFALEDSQSGPARGRQAQRTSLPPGHRAPRSAPPKRSVPPGSASPGKPGIQGKLPPGRTPVPPGAQPH